MILACSAQIKWQVLILLMKFKFVSKFLFSSSISFRVNFFFSWFCMRNWTILYFYQIRDTRPAPRIKVKIAINKDIRFQQFLACNLQIKNKEAHLLLKMHWLSIYKSITEIIVLISFIFGKFCNVNCMCLIVICNFMSFIFYYK